MMRSSRTIATAIDDYDWKTDHLKNIEFAYAFIRERVAKGGKGWKGYAMWQLIETAPKDTEVLIYGSFGYAVAYYDSLGHVWLSGDRVIDAPTNWKFLEPPK